MGRGGPLRPMASGVYAVNAKIYEDLKVGVQTEHAFKLGGLIAKGLADQVSIPAYIVDPVSVDELEPIARITGMPEIERHSLFHALNMKALALRAAKDLKADYNEITLIIVHLGGGVSVGVQKQGKMIDVCNANGNGPFSLERAGYVPAADFAKMCFSGKYSQADIKKKLVGNRGVVAHLGINDGKEIESRISAGDEKTRRIFEAMGYNIAK